jgi:hypothetical protein
MPRMAQSPPQSMVPCCRRHPRPSADGCRRASGPAGGPARGRLPRSLAAYTVNAAAGEDIRLLHRETWADTLFGERPPTSTSSTTPSWR